MINKNGLGFLSWVIAAVLLIAVFILIEKPASVSAQDEPNTIRAFQQKRFSFDIQNGSIRFSHGNHRRRDRWFRAYFGSGYSDCSNCHHLEFPEAEEGTRVNFVAEIRKHANDTIPYGIQEETCLSCHNNITAPNDCQWCHVPGSPPLQGKEAAQLGEYEESVDPIIPDYDAPRHSLRGTG